ncbi:MAG TPA: 4-hydroxy-tetrahydrodipicolinate synthase [Bacilli bacterium]
MSYGKIVTAMVTPFDGQLRINWDETGRLVDYLIAEQGTDSIVVSGTTGESPTLTDEEKLELFRFVVKRAAGRCKIIAGTGSNNTAHSIHLTREAEKCGVDAALLVAPYYNKPDQEGLYRHFKAIAEKTSLPIMLYNIPGRSIVQIHTETILRLAEIENIVAIKECGPLDHIAELYGKAPEHFLIYSGDDSALLPVLSIGGVGIVSVASHVIGRRMRVMIEAFFAGDYTKAAKLHAELLPIFKGLFVTPSPGPVKAALKLHGIEAGEVRLPLVMPNEDKLRQIAALFHRP